VNEHGHKWLWGLLVHITDQDANEIARGRRMTFHKLDPFDGSKVQGAAVFCERCQRAFMECRNEPCFDNRRLRASALVLPTGVR
jgi:hypothetical protein